MSISGQLCMHDSDCYDWNCATARIHTHESTPSQVSLSSRFFFHSSEDCGCKQRPDEIAPYNVESMSALFGVCVYAFMCHHSLPSLLTPVENKENLWMLVPGVLGLVLLFYLLLCFTAVFRFSLEELNGTNGL